MNARALPLAALVAAAAAAAAGAAVTREGTATWAFDDVSVRDSAGARRKSEWSQGYDAGLRGPLFLPSVGELLMHGNFTDGFDLGQAVNTSSPRRKVLTGSADGTLLPDRLRRYAQLAPHYSWSQSWQASNSAGPSRLLKDEDAGLSGGLSLPGLPSVSLSRFSARTRDPSLVSPVDRKTLQSNEDVGYARGGFRLALSRRASTVEDLTGRSATIDGETRQGEAVWQRYDLLRLGLQSLSLRSNVFSTRAQGAVRQEDATGDVNLRSLPLKRGAWKHLVGASSGYRRDDLTSRQSDASALDLQSHREGPWGSVVNSVAAGVTVAGGTARSASESLSVEEKLRKGRLTLTEGVSTGWGDSAGGAARRTDGLSARLSILPRPGRDLNLGWRAASARTLGGGPGSLEQVADAVGRAQLLRRLQLNVNLMDDRRRSSQDGVLTVSDRAGLVAQGMPRRSMEVSLGASYSRFRSSAGPASEAASATLGFNWLPTPRLSLHANMAAAKDSLNWGAGASYTAGRTSLAASYTTAQFAGAQSYAHTNVTLSRSF